MGPNADDTPVRPSFQPYTVPRVDCCTTEMSGTNMRMISLLIFMIVYYDQSIDNTGS